MKAAVDHEPGGPEILRDGPEILRCEDVPARR